jgi:RHS repeat-associated protein
LNKGQLTEKLTAAAGAIPATAQLYDFDEMTRIVHHKQTVGSQTYTMSYSYNLGGALASQTYPSGRIVSYAFDDAARLSQVSSQVGATNAVYASQYDYTSPTGLLKSVTLGNGAIESYVYNSRLQLQSLELTKNGTQLQRYDYKYGVYDPVAGTIDPTKNNGQIAQIEGSIQAQQQWKQSLVYDKLGRLSSGREFRGDDGTRSYLANYEYDVFGNRYQKQAQNANNPFPQVWVEDGQINQATNRFNTGLGLTYDDAGNITTDSKFRNRKFTYDANNRQKQSRNLDDSGAVDSVFDAGGQRVAIQVGGVLTSVLVYDVTGKLLAEYNSNTALGGTQYAFTDAQGTPRTVTNNQGTVIARHDYLPFGEDIPNNVGLRASTSGYGGIDAARLKYAAMENDEATGMSHTLWRKYDCLSARWTSPDPYGGSMTLSEPQSFNRYIYVNNDPVNHVDPTGLALSDIGVYQTGNATVATIVHRIQFALIRNHVSQRSGTGITNGRAAQQVAINRAINRGVEKHGMKFLPNPAPAEAAPAPAAASGTIVPCDVVISAGRNRAIVEVALGEGTPFFVNGNVNRPTRQFAKEQQGGMLGQLTEQDYREEAYYMASVIVNRFNQGGFADYIAVVEARTADGDLEFEGLTNGRTRINELGQNGSEYCERARYIIDSLNYIDRQGGTNNNFLFWRGVEQQGLPGGRRAFREGDQRAANTDFMHMSPDSAAYDRLRYLTNNGWRTPRR